MDELIDPPPELETPVDPAPVEQDVAAEKPATMLDAINQHFDKQETEADRARDQKGRFVTEPKNPDPLKPVEKPADKPLEKVDLRAMPDGLKPESQRRFQALANQNAELTQKYEQSEQQLSYLRETFQTNNIQREQFEQAVSFIGMVNKGDLKSARDFLQGQLKEISLRLGEPIPGVDALQSFPDLRQSVDSMQITEAHALELARARKTQAQQQEHHQQYQQQQQTQQQAEQAHTQGMKDVDSFCKEKQGKDLDYDSIEAKLLPVIARLLEGVPPNLWRAKVEAQYDLLKQAMARQPSPTNGSVLRPTGVSSPSQKPKTAYEAMWGAPAPV